MFTSNSAIAENLILSRDIISVQLRNGSVRTRILCKHNEGMLYLVSSNVVRIMMSGASNNNDRPWQKLPALKYNSYLLNLMLSC